MESKGLLSFTALVVIFCCLHSMRSAPSHRYPRQVNQNDTIVFALGTCKDCYKLLMRDLVTRHQPWYSSVPVNTILSYDGVGCHADEKIKCVKVTDYSSTHLGANVTVVSGGTEQPYIRLNITAKSPGKGYSVCVEMRGYDPLKPDCK